MQEAGDTGRRVLSGIKSDASGADRISARERDLDNFLIEELSASQAFQEWFLIRLKEFVDVPAYSRVTAGKNPKREATTGQTDLSCVLWDDSGNEIVHVLIEDKVALGFQLGQPERYAEEVAAAQRRLGPRKAAAVLVAPSSNRAVLDHPCFDVSIRIEEIISHLRDRRQALSKSDCALNVELSARLAARIELLDALLKKRSYSGNWTPNPIPEKLDFFTQYRAIASGLAPQFETTDSSGGRKATTMIFRVPPITGISVRHIRHEFRGLVSLEFVKAAGAKGRLDRSGLLPRGATTDDTNAGTLLVRLGTAPVEARGEHFADQQQSVESAISAAMLLYDWATQNRTKLMGIMGAA